MYKHSKFIASLISLVMIFSIVVSSFSVVHASAPIKRSPATVIPNKKTPPTIEAPNPIRSRPLKLTNTEAPAQAKGVSYKLKEGVERLPSDMDYNLEQIKIDEFASFDTSTQDQTKDLGKVNGIKYRPGSKFLVLPKELSSASKLQKNKIYINENEGLAYRVLEEGKTDSNGNSQYVVDNPNLTEIFESYKIPAQDIKLTTGNIAYMAPGVELDPASGMTKDYYAAAGDNGYISGYKKEGNKHILNLTANKIIFQYPSKEDKQKTKEEKEKAEKEKFEGAWWDKEKGTDLKGFEGKDELSVEVAIKKGQIVIEDPVFHADFDFHWTSWMKADFYFESKTKADVTFVGDLSIDKSMEACIFGYDINLGSIGGEGDGNRAFVGIFLVMGANGKVHVEVRTTTTGSARAGYEYKALGFGLLPYKVGPYCRYKPTGFDADFQIDGELHLVMACVPQVGVIIWGHNIGALQIWVGYKADAKFGISGGGGSTTDTSLASHASLEASGFAKLLGILFDKEYEIFKLEFPLYSGEWVVGEKVNAAGGDGIVTIAVTPSFLVKADAYYDTIEGQIVFGEDKLPFANRDYQIEIWNSSLKELKTTIPGYTDAEGKFNINSRGYSYNLLPTDRVVIDIEQFDIYIDDSAEKYFKVGDKVYELTEIKSKDVKASVPFTKIDFNVDTVNDLITGTVTGKYGQFSGPIDIKVVNKNFSEKKYKTAVVDGIFSLKVPIDQNTWNVWAEINCDGFIFPDNKGVCREPNLGALEIHFYNDYTQIESNINRAEIDVELNIPTLNIPGMRPPSKQQGSIIANIDKDDAGNKVIRPTKVFGTITNSGEMGSALVQGGDYIRDSRISNTSVEPYTGSVKITSLPIKSAMLDIINKKDRSNLTDPIVNTPGWTAVTQAKRIIMEGEATSAALFEFDKPEVLAYEIEIEYEGLTKTVRYNPFVFHYERTLQNIDEFARQPLQKDITIITEDKKDAIINPADSSLNKWQGSWITNIGAMQLKQEGNFINGTIIQNGKEYAIEGSISNGVFRGSILLPSESSIFGDITSFEMDMSSDGRSINFKSFGMNTKLKGLNGTKAIKQ